MRSPVGLGVDMRRREFLGGLSGAAAAWPVVALGQQASRIRRIGVMASVQESDPALRAWLTAFRDALEAFGWVDGRNIKVEYRWGDSSAELIRARSKELAALNLDVILVAAASSLVRLKEVAHTTPIVFANVPDPVINGFVASLSRPGGNITGFANYEQAVGAKWIELLKQIAPRVTRAAFIYDPSNPATIGYLRAAETAASSFAISVTSSPVQNADDLERIIGATASEPNGGVVIPPGPLTFVHRALIVRLAARHYLPVVSPYSDDVKAGILASSGVDPIPLFRSAASYVDRILKGEKPGDL